MKNIYIKIIVLIIISSIYVTSTSASTFDDFADCDITDWTLIGTGWTAQPDTSGCYMQKTTSTTVSNQFATKSATDGHYYEFDLNYSNTAATGTGQTWAIYFKSNTTETRGFVIDTMNPVTSMSVIGSGFTITQFNLTRNTWYTFKITISGTNLIMNVTDRATGAQATPDQTVPYVDMTATEYKFGQLNKNAGSTSIGNIDNIVISQFAPSSVSTTHIEFDNTEYFNNDLITITWGQIDSEWTDIFYFKTIVLEWNDENGIQHDTQLIASPPQAGTYVFQIYQIGSYVVKLQKSFLGIGTPILMAEDTAIVRSESQSYIYTDSPTAFMRVPFNVHYSIGYSLIGYTSEIEIIGTNSVTGGIIEVSIIDASLGNTGTQIMQQTDVKVWPEGKYTLKLYDARKDQVLDTKFITIVNDPRLIPVLQFNVSNISTDRTAYFINDYMTVDFTIDDANFTNYTIRADVYNFNTSTITKQFFTAFTSQTGSFETLVNSKINMQCDRGVYCWFEPGNNQIQLMRYNDTYSDIIAFQNFTVASTTVDGWGLSLSSQNISTTDTLTMKVIVPAGQTGRLQIRDPGFSPNATKIYTIDNIDAGTQTYKTTITRVGISGKGYYEVEIIDKSNEVVKMHLPITVTRSTAAATPPTTIQDKTDDFLSSGMMIVFIILIVFVAAGAYIGGFAGAVVGFGGGFLFCASFGLIPMWALFLFAILIIAAFAFVASDKLTGGGNG